MSFSFSGIGSITAVAAHARQKADEAAKASPTEADLIRACGEVAAVAVEKLTPGAEYVVSGHFSGGYGNLSIVVGRKEILL